MPAVVERREWKLRVLLIEDPSRDSIAHVISCRGHLVFSANDLDAGLMLIACGPDVAVIDLEVGGDLALEVARVFREIAFPIRLVAVAESSSDPRAAMEAGFDHHLTRPIDVDALIRLLEAPLEWRAAHVD